MSLKFSPFTFLQTANTVIMAASLSFLFGLSTLSVRKADGLPVLASKRFAMKNKLWHCSIAKRAHNLYFCVWWLWIGRCLPQSTYRGRVEIRGVYLPSQIGVHQNFWCDGRYSERGWACTSTLTRQSYFYHHDGMYARKWPLPFCVYSVVYTGQMWYLCRWVLSLISRAMFM